MTVRIGNKRDASTMSQILAIADWPKSLFLSAQRHLRQEVRQFEPIFIDG